MGYRHLENCASLDNPGFGGSPAFHQTLKIDFTIQLPLYLYDVGHGLFPVCPVGQ